MSKIDKLIEVKDLRVSVEDTEILRGINLSIGEGEVHAIMGPNGSGKSTLANVIAGRPGYSVTGGDIVYKGKSLLEVDPEIRARAGIFLAFQYPVELPGVRTWQFLKAAIDAVRKENGKDELSVREFDQLLEEKRELVEMDPDLVKRSVNEGFSGGEKKRNEILQMLMLEPTLSILDETDSGLDIDSMKVVASGVNAFRNENTSSLIITHYERLLNYITPDYVHVFHNGVIIKTGDIQLAKDLEKRGYEWLTNP